LHSNDEEEIPPALRLPGIGKQTAKHLARLEIHSVQDLLFHLPLRYQDRTQIQAIRQLVPDREAVVEGVITSVSRPEKGKTKLLVELRDATGVIYLRFFHILSFQTDVLKKGNRIRCYSDVRLIQNGLAMTHPEFKLIAEGKQIPVDPHLTPIYPLTEGLSQFTLRKLTTNALTKIEREKFLEDLLPSHLLEKFAFPDLKTALQFVHRPPQNTSMPALLEIKTPAQQRLVFEELLAHRLSLLQIKSQHQKQTAIALGGEHEIELRFRAGLNFQLTQAQEKVLKEIHADLSKQEPMLRLLQGDVGSGKTVVAASAMLQAVAHQYQAAVMAPTELLAEQHARVFKRWLEPLGINVIFLAGNVKGKARKEAMLAIESGSAQVVVGTHALFQEEVKFAKLALLVVDEQHRFGVEQRASFREKGRQGDFYPHQLVMTATPIPRTLAMSFYADLDCSTIDELPPGRTPIMTSVLAASKREEVIERIRKACVEGRQVYWVCPLIDESETLNCQAATTLWEQLQQFLPEFKVGLVHGRLKSSEKEAVMRAFQAAELNILVATTVIEVGVDVPNASVMVIENAERLGLSQLHQLRGRVGRGQVASFCLLLYQYPISNLGKERLQVMRETNDGFKIAQRDLELRGPGELLGTRQTGELNFYVADLIRDNELLPKVQEAADIIMRDHANIVKALMERWLDKANDYAKV